MILSDNNFEREIKKELKENDIKKDIICKLMNILFVFEDVDVKEALELLSNGFEAKNVFLIEVDKSGSMMNINFIREVNLCFLKDIINTLSHAEAIRDYLLFPIKDEKNVLKAILGFEGLRYDVFERDKKSFELIVKMIYKFIQNRNLKVKHKEVFENAGTALCIVDNAGIIIEVNKAYEKLSGYEKEEIEGKINFEIFVHPDDKEKVINYHRKRISDTNIPESYEWRYIDRYNNVKNVLVNVKMIPNTDLRVVSMIDITTSKEKDRIFAEYSNRYESLFKNNNSVMMIIDPETGKIVEVNDAAAKFYGYDIEKLMNMKIYEINLLGKERVFEEIRKAVNMEQKSFNFKHRRAYGDIRDVEVFSGPIKYNDKIMLYSIVHDITEKKTIEKHNERLLDSIVHTLASVVETRDPYTAGHQDRVAKLSVAIAKEMGLKDDILKAIKMAAILHDIGKIKIPSEILSKPGAISQIEFELIKEHARTSFDILSKINFKYDIAKIVYQHHERLDGTGYPLGLEKKDILIEARIIAVADVVEAMSFHRPYRPALGIDAALDEITRYSGIRYDEEVVYTCEKLFEKYGYNFD